MMINNIYIYLLFVGLFFGQEYDYSYEDVNPNSDLNGTFVGPSYFNNKITINYFGWES